MKKIIANEKSMLELGAKLATLCATAKTIIFLHGPLGAGKTTLVRGFLQSLGHQGAVKSPTYTLVEAYELPKTKVFHFDFYRLRDAEELELIGIHDYFAQEGIFLIEWPEIGLNCLPAADLSCYIQVRADGREVEFQAHSTRGKNVVENL